MKWDAEINMNTIFTVYAVTHGPNFNAQLAQTRRKSHPGHVNSKYSKYSQTNKQHTHWNNKKKSKVKIFITV